MKKITGKKLMNPPIISFLTVFQNFGISGLRMLVMLLQDDLTSIP